MLIRATVVCAFLLGAASAFAPSSNVHGVSSTRLNLESEDKDVFPSNPSVDDRRSFVTKVSVIRLLSLESVGIMTRKS